MTLNMAWEVFLEIDLVTSLLVISLKQHLCSRSSSKNILISRNFVHLSDLRFWNQYSSGSYRITVFATYIIQSFNIILKSWMWCCIWKESHKKAHFGFSGMLNAVKARYCNKHLCRFKVFNEFLWYLAIKIKN